MKVVSLEIYKSRLINFSREWLEWNLPCSIGMYLVHLEATTPVLSGAVLWVSNEALSCWVISRRNATGPVF